MFEDKKDDSDLETINKRLNEKEFLTISELSKETGISKDWIRFMIAQGYIPCWGVGKKYIPRELAHKGILQFSQDEAEQKKRTCQWAHKK